MRMRRVVGGGHREPDMEPSSISAQEAKDTAQGKPGTPNRRIRRKAPGGRPTIVPRYVNSLEPNRFLATSGPSSAPRDRFMQIQQHAGHMGPSRELGLIQPRWDRREPRLEQRLCRRRVGPIYREVLIQQGADGLDLVRRRSRFRAKPVAMLPARRASVACLPSDSRKIRAAKARAAST